MYFPNRLELSFLMVLAFPKAERQVNLHAKKNTERKQNYILRERSNECTWVHVGNNPIGVE